MTVERDSIAKPPAMTSIHLFVDRTSVGPVLGWLAQQCCISPREITSWIGPDLGDQEQSVPELQAIPSFRIENGRDTQGGFPG